MGNGIHVVRKQEVALIGFGRNRVHPEGRKDMGRGGKERNKQKHSMTHVYESVYFGC